MVSTPSSWLTMSGWPLMLVMSRAGASLVARTATEPAMARTRRAVTSSKARRVGASTVHCGIGCLLSRPVTSLFTYDISCPGLVGRSSWAVIGNRRSVVLVEPGQPAGQPVDGRVELRVEVHEVPEPLGQPGQADLLLAPPFVELFDALVGEVHRSSVPWPRRGAAGSRPARLIRPAPPQSAACAWPRAAWPSRWPEPNWPAATPGRACARAVR